MKKIGSVVLGLSVIGIVSIGLNSSFTYQAEHGDTPAPQRPDLAYSDGHTGGSPANNKGDGGIVSNKGDTPVQQA
ncbi:Phr family secreted Rap phosphatase inhibitor [Bacillus sp. JJ864]|uniref:Phr family secreted Rap phosphatase inhibitor n=1 Tax=Bacillus sp. JJ864 TaxID=3122975 RepID=UPI003F689B32